MEIIVIVFWLMLPAYVSNMMPPFLAVLFPSWKTPMDFGLHFRGRRILGDHKTVRGLLLSSIVAQLVYLLQLKLYPQYLADLPIHFGFVLGISALFGDAVKSFVKRQLDIAPGVVWFPLDQIDFVLASLVVIGLFMKIDLVFVVVALSMGLVLTMLGKVIGYLIGVNRSPI